jgi:hypothetical protein
VIAPCLDLTIGASRLFFFVYCVIVVSIFVRGDLECGRVICCAAWIKIGDWCVWHGL